MKKRIVVKNELYEAASPWMNSALIGKEFNGDDYRIGFELEWKADVSNYEGGFDEISGKSEDEYVERIDELVIEELNSTNLYEVYLDEDSKAYFFEDWFGSRDDVLNTSEFIKQDYDVIISTLRLTRESKLLLKQWKDEILKSDFSNNYKRLIEVIDNIELDSRVAEDEKEANEFEDNIESDAFGKNTCEWFLLNPRIINSKLDELDNQTDLFGEKWNNIKSFYNLIMMDSGDYRKLRGMIFTDIFEDTVDSAGRDIRENIERDNPYEGGDNNAYGEIAGELRNIFGNRYNYEASGEYGHTSDTNTFDVKTDSSISEGRGEKGVEIATPAFNGYKIAISALGELFEYINNNGSTDNSCGLHININDENYRKNSANRLKMQMLFGEFYFMEYFDRTDTSYAVSNKHEIYKKVDEYLSYEMTEDKQLTKEKINNIISKLEGFFNEYGSYHHAIQSDHSGYFEFRLAGGKNYQQKPISKYEQMIKIMCNVITIASTDKYNDEYRKMLIKLITSKYDEYYAKNNELEELDRRINEYISQIPSVLNSQTNQTWLSLARMKLSYISELSAKYPLKHMKQIEEKLSKWDVKTAMEQVFNTDYMKNVHNWLVKYSPVLKEKFSKVE